MSLVKQALNKLPAAVGATVSSDPVVGQAMERVRQGKLSKEDFSTLYSGPVKASTLQARAKHAPKHGLRPITGDRQVKTLQET